MDVLGRKRYWVWLSGRGEGPGYDCHGGEKVPDVVVLEGGATGSSCFKMRTDTKILLQISARWAAVAQRCASSVCDICSLYFVVMDRVKDTFCPECTPRSGHVQFLTCRERRVSGFYNENRAR